MFYHSFGEAGIEEAPHCMSISRALHGTAIYAIDVNVGIDSIRGAF